MSKSNVFASECKVCSAEAFNTFYGAKVCEPCKVFFRRNAENSKGTLKCDFDGHCEINIYNRHVCSACRLKKCFQVGMCTQMIRGPRVMKKKTNLTSLMSTNIITQRNTKLQQLRPINILEQDQSLLTIDQWTHLSNLIHSYDEYNALPYARNYMKELESLPLKLRFKIDSKKVIEIIGIFHQATKSFIQANHDFNLLSVDDRSIVVHGAIDNVSCLSGGFLLRQSGLIANLAFCQGLENTYGNIPYSLTLTIISLIDQDIILVKLTLSLFAFCTTSCTLFDKNNSISYIKDNQPVLRIQNMYAELIWKYLLYKYTFNEAVVRFSQLVKCLVVTFSVRTHLQTVTNHTTAVDELIQEIDQQCIDVNHE